MAIRFTWEPKKAKRNLRRHKIAFDVAQNVFSDPHVVIVEDLDYQDEIRFHAIGFCTEKLLAVVVYVDLSETEADESGSHYLGPQSRGSRGDYLCRPIRLRI